MTYRRIEYNLQIAAAQTRKLKLVLYALECRRSFFRQTPERASSPPTGILDLHIHDLISLGSDADGMLTLFNRVCIYGNSVPQQPGCPGDSAPGT